MLWLLMIAEGLRNADGGVCQVAAMSAAVAARGGMRSRMQDNGVVTALHVLLPAHLVHAVLETHVLPLNPTLAYFSSGCCCTSVSKSMPDSTGAARLLAVQNRRQAAAMAMRCLWYIMMPMMYSLSKGARVLRANFTES